MKRIFSAFLLAIAMTAPAAAVENCCYNMAGGSFGVAWIDSIGEIRVFDGQKSVRLNGFYERGDKIAVLDLDGDGRDTLAVISKNKKALYVIDVEKTIETGKTVVLSAGNGNNIKGFCTAPAGTAHEPKGSVIVSTYSGSSYMWNKDYDGKGWPAIPGDFSQVSSGMLKAKMPAQFAVVTHGDVYTYNPAWMVYSQKLMGRNVNSTICGNFAPLTKEDEIIAAAEDETYIIIGNKSDALGKAVKCMTVGNGPEKDVLIAVDKDGVLCRYDRTEKAWTTLCEGKAGFVSVVTAPNADGTYTIYATSEDGLFSVSTDGKSAKLVDGLSKTRIPLKADGKVVAQFQTGGLFKPYVEKLYTPGGVQVLLDSPFDHIHHHGLMYSMGINDYEFWGEYSDKCAYQVLTKVDSDESSVKAELNWVTPNGELLAKETREIAAASENGANVLNWKSVLTPAGDKAVKIWGRHYFGLGMRFAEEMNTNVKFTNSTGAHDGAIVRGDERLKDCQWINAVGTVGGKGVSVTIEEKDGNTRPMTGYSMGEGWKAFAYMGATMRVHENPIMLEPGQSITAAYKVIVKDNQ